MAEIYPTHIWTAAKWQQERDAARVPGGACPGVSLAGELVRFHAEFARGIGPNAGLAAKRLEDKVKLYVAAVQQRYPVWGRKVGTLIGDRLRVIREDLERMGKATALYNKAVGLVQAAWPQAHTDVDDWMGSGGGFRLASREYQLVVAGLREIAVQGQLLSYVSDRLERGVWLQARRCWSAVDGGRSPTQQWLEDTADLRLRLRPL